MFPFAATDDAELTHEEWTVRRRRRRAGAAGAAAAVSVLGAAGPAQAMLPAEGGGGGTPKPTTTPTSTPSPSPQVDPKPPTSRAADPAPTTPQRSTPATPVDNETTPRPQPTSAPEPRRYADDRRQPMPAADPEPPRSQPAPETEPPRYADDRRQPVPAADPEPPRAQPTPEAEPPRYADDRRQPMPVAEPSDPRPSPRPGPSPTAVDHQTQTEPKPAGPPSTPTEGGSAWMDEYLRTITEPPKKPEPKPKVEVPAGTDPDLAQLLLPGNEVVVKPQADPDRDTPEPARNDTPVPTDEPSGTEPRDETEPDRQPSGPASPATPPRLGTQATPPRSDPSWVDFYLDSVTNPTPAPKPEPRPEVPENLTPYELDKGMTGPLLGPLYTPGEVEGARQRLEEPNVNLQGRIDELNDQYDDQNFIGPKTQQQQQELDRIGDERTLREQQLVLYANGHCDYDCDVNAPYKPGGSLDDPFDAAAEELPDGATRAEVLTKAQEMAEQQRREAAEQPEEEEGPSGGHLALDVAGLAGPIGPFADGANTIWYAAEGDWGNAGFSLFGAVPIVGDIAKGGKLLKTGAKAVDKANDVDNAVDATRVATRDPSELAKNYAENNLGGKFDMSDGSDEALAGIFGKTASGSPVNAARPGQFLPSQTRGYATELRALNELAARSDVTSIKAVPSAPGGRTPDFLVTKADGTVERVEVTTVTGAGSGYKPRGIGLADAPSKSQIKDALRRKTQTSSQFNSKLDGVDEGGSLVIGLRGGENAGAEAGNAIADMTQRLADSKVREVTFTMGNGQTQRYVLENGAYVLK